jgi:hypothetical protein
VLPRYRVYSNGGTGGPVDLATPAADVDALSWSSAPLAPGRWSFLVRAYDPATGFEERNVDARFSVEVSGSGADVTGRPQAPSGVSASASPGGAAAVTWAFAPNGRPAPSEFRVYLAPHGTTPGAPAAVVPYAALRSVFSASVPGLAAGVAYDVAVSSANAAGESGAAPTASVTAPAAPPAPPVAGASGATP